MILPGKAADIAGLVATAMQVVKKSWLLNTRCTI
ncbi:MAG TPA: hypothetical protein VIM35_04545 [Gallionella sp.]